MISEDARMESKDATEPVGRSLIRTVAEMPDVQDTVSDYAEISVDAFVDSGVLDKIPIIGTMRALARGVAGFREARLLQKLTVMLFALGNVSAAESADWSKKLREDEHVEEFGERVIGIVERVESAMKARLVGLMFRAYLDGRCDRNTFLRSIEMIDRALTEDLAYLVEHWADGATGPACDRLVSVGLLADRSISIVTEGSQPPAPSSEGDLIRSAVNSPAS